MGIAQGFSGLRRGCRDYMDVFANELIKASTIQTKYADMLSSRSWVWVFSNTVFCLKCLVCKLWESEHMVEDNTTGHVAKCLWTFSQRVHVGIWNILRAQRASHIPTLGPIPKGP